MINASDSFIISTSQKLPLLAAETICPRGPLVQFKAVLDTFVPDTVPCLTLPLSWTLY